MKHSWILLFLFSFFATANTNLDFVSVEIELNILNDQLLENKSSSYNLDSSNLESIFTLPLSNKSNLKAKVKAYWLEDRINVKMKDLYFKYFSSSYFFELGVLSISFPILYFKEDKDWFVSEILAYKPLNLKNHSRLGVKGSWLFDSKNKLEFAFFKGKKIFRNSYFVLNAIHSKKNYDFILSYLFQGRETQTLLSQSPFVHSVGGGLKCQFQLPASLFFQLKAETWWTQYQKANLDSVFSAYIFPQWSFKRWQLGFMLGHLCQISEASCVKAGSYEYVGQLGFKIKDDVLLLFGAVLKKDTSLITEKTYALRLLVDF